MDKQIKKILGKTLIGVLTLIFVLFLSVPVAYGADFESVNGKFEVNADSSQNAIYAYPGKYVAASNAVIRMAKYDYPTKTFYYATDAKVGVDTVNVLPAPVTSTEFFRISDNNYQILTITPGINASNAVTAVSGCNPSWNTDPELSSLACGYKSTLYTSDTATMDSYSGAYTSGNLWYVYGPANDNVLTMWEVNSTDGSVTAYPVYKEESTNNWVTINVLDVSADGISANESAVVFKYGINGQAVAAATVCTVVDCGISGIDDDRGYITNVPSGDTLHAPKTLATDPNAASSKLEITSIGYDNAAKTLVLYKDSANKLQAVKTDFVNDPTSLQISDPNQNVILAKTAELSLDTDSNYKTPIVYSDGSKTVYTTLNTTTMTKTVNVDMEVGTIKSLAAGLIASPTTELVSGTTKTLKSGTLNLGGSIGPLNTFETFGGGGVAIPEFPTKWVAMLVGAVALIAGVAIASWRKKKVAE